MDRAERLDRRTELRRKGDASLSKSRNWPTDKVGANERFQNKD